MTRVGDTLGVEEEFHLVNADGSLSQAAEEVLRVSDGEVEHELMASMVETATPVCADLGEIDREVRRARATLLSAADAAGVRVVAAGSVPCELPQDAAIYPLARYEDMVADYGEVGRQQVVCAVQWHVGVPDREDAVRITGALGRWLPVLLALSASSPYFDGRDTGFASYRSEIWARWPTAGTTGDFTSASDYDAVVAALIRAGVASDPGMIYFDARPSARYPTVEIRVADACPRAQDVVTLAGLVQALVVTLANDAPHPPPRAELLRAATWTAARRGLGSTLLHPATFAPVPAREALESLLSLVLPATAELGTTELIRHGVEAIMASGGSSARQRAVRVGGGSLNDVVDHLVAETRQQA